MTTALIVFVNVMGMLAAFWFGYKAGAKEPLRLQPYPEFVDLVEEAQKAIPIEEEFDDEE